MNSKEDKEKDIQRREAELLARENAIRLREIEAEIDKSAEITKTPNKQAKSSKPKRWGRKIIRIAKFSGFVILVIFLVRFALWLATIATIGALAWVGYKLFLEGDKKD